MEQKQVHPEEEYSFLDFSSSSTLLLQCSIDSEGEHTSFEWTDYGIEAFSKLQQLDEIDIDDYMDSVRGHETLRFLLSHKNNVTSVLLSIDDRFILKIISKSQMKFFLEMLPKYYEHMKKYKNTLLTPFYGLHVVKPQGGQKVRFVVSKNIIKSDVSIHKQFMFRVSSHCHCMHKARDEEDINMAFQLPPSIRHVLMTQLKHDCSFLEGLDIIQYSLLLGMHICPAPFETVIQVRDSAAHSSGSYHSNKGSGGQESENNDSDQDLGSDYDSVSSCPKQIEGKFGIRMAAQSVSKRRKESNLASTTHTSGKDQHNNLIIFFGIVDIIPHCSMLRHVEHVFRSLRGDGSGSYSARFQEYLLRVFPEND